MVQSGRRKIREILIRTIPASLLHRIRMVRYANRMREGGENYEPEMELVRVLAGKKDCVADIGASLGWYTRILSEIVGPGGLVCSFEPMPYQFQILDFVRKRLKLENVNLMKAALSDTAQTMTMVAPKKLNGEPDLYLSHITINAIPDNHLTVEVRTKRFDDVELQIGRKFRFVKCDVEGHEFEVLAGARSILRDSQPSWMMEVWGDPDDPSDKGYKVFQLMQTEGYRAYVFENHVVKQRVHGERSRNGNYFFLKPSHLASVEARFSVR
jgi:FkbM family methyltransferase